MRKKREDVMTAADVVRALKARSDPEKAAFFPVSSKPAPASTGKGTGFSE